MSTSTLETTGHHIDAVTAKRGPHTAISAAGAQPSKMKHIDGFIKPAASVHHTSTVSTAARVKTKTPKRHSVHMSAPTQAHAPESSHTLMRRAVHKPDVQKAPQVKVHAAVDSPAVHLVHTRQPHPLTAIKASRLERAKQVTPSPLVKRFHPLQGAASPGTVIQPQVIPMPVQHAPADSGVATSLHTAETKAQQLIEQALANATSHEAKPHHPPRHIRAASVLAALGASLLIAGFVFYQNLPAINIKIASTHAGFQAVLPGYAPAGYALSHSVQAAPGTVNLSFHSTTDGRTFSIQQQASNWDSQTLRDSLASAGTSFNTLQDAGRTIFVMNKGNNQATWVNGGILYRIAGSANLSTSQLVNIAASM